MKKFQIGIMGSCSDLNYSREIEKLAEEIGAEIATHDAILLFGAEKDLDSLSTAACRGAKNAGGLTIGITYGQGQSIIQKDVDVILVTGIERGGGREFILVNSCDAIICIGGGSGTLNEMTIAYMAEIPIITMKNSGGWSEKLANSYLDARKRVLIREASDAKEAVKMALALATEHRAVSAKSS